MKTIVESPRVENPFEYLCGLFEGEKASFQSKDFVVHITKSKDKKGKVAAIKVEIADSRSEERDEGVQETYCIDKDGVYEMIFRYPPITGVPPAPTPHPEDMTESQRKELARVRAEKVADFVRNIRETKP